MYLIKWPPTSRHIFYSVLRKLYIRHRYTITGEKWEHTKGRTWFMIHFNYLSSPLHSTISSPTLSFHCYPPSHFSSQWYERKSNYDSPEGGRLVRDNYQNILNSSSFIITISLMFLSFLSLLSMSGSLATPPMKDTEN